mgnify:CR=1 FL=1
MVQYLFFSLVFYIFIWIIDFTEQTLDILVIFNVLNLIALIFYSYQKSKSIINAVIVFNITGFLYSNYGYFFGVNLSSYYYSKCLLLSSIAIQSYNIAYITWKIRKSTSKNTSYNFGKIWVISMLMMLLGVAIELYFFFFYIGFSNFISMTRSARSLMMIDAFYLANFYKPIITTSSLILLVCYLEKGGSFGKKIVVISSICLCIFNAIIEVSRANFIMIILPLVYILYKYKKITQKQVGFAFISIFISMALWKYILTNGFVFNSNAIQLNSELVSWIKIGNNIIMDIENDQIDYLLGKSYLDTILNILYPFSGIESLSTWYVRTYEYSVFLRGGGRGFSSVIEAYYNFEVFGCVIVYFFYGILYKKIFSEESSVLYILIQAVLLSLIYKLFRSEAYSLWKNIWWLQLLPIILIFSVSKEKGNEIK